MSTNEVKVLRRGELIKCNQKAFNKDGVLRLRLADGSGWTSATGKKTGNVLAGVSLDLKQTIIIAFFRIV